MGLVSTTVLTEVSVFQLNPLEGRVVSAAMARFTTTSRGKLDFAINVLLKFYNPVISINRIMTN